MKILICSDIHSNFEALKETAPFLKKVDKAICLGDIIGYGCAVNECIDYLRENGFICIQGNHDRYLLEGTEGQTKFLNESVLFGIDVARSTISESNLYWLFSLPISIGFNFGGRKMLFVHGSPFNPTDEYIYDNTLDPSKFKDFIYDAVFMGHTHRELIYRSNNQIIVNPGSIGQSRDHEGRACFIIFDTDDLKIEHYRIGYDFNRHLELSLKHGGGEWLYKHFKHVNQ